MLVLFEEDEEDAEDEEDEDWRFVFFFIGFLSRHLPMGYLAALFGCLFFGKGGGLFVLFLWLLVASFVDGRPCVALFGCLFF